MLKTVCFWLPVLVIFSCQSPQVPAPQALLYTINWTDSVSIQQTIHRLSVCEQIRLANDSAHVFAKGQGNCLRLLQAISKEMKTSVNIPIGIAGILITDEDRLADLREQLAAIQRKFCER